jgi:flagellar protein FliS
MTDTQGNGFPMNQTMLRAAYVSSSVDTMSPGRMITSLYERLTVDLIRSEQAISDGDIPTAHECLLHAQAIVTELHDTLDVQTWPAARGLKDIYVFLLFELVAANVGKDAARVVSCRGLVVPLRDAWNEATGIVTSPVVSISGPGAGA